MKDKIQNYQNSSMITTILLVVSFLVLNWLSYSLYIRFDISNSGTLRLTSASKKILRGLPEIVTLEAFISEDVPDTLIKSVKDLRDFLTEYANASDGHVKLIFLDPDSDKDTQKRAQEYGIRSTTQAGKQGSGINIKNVYLSVLMTYEDKKEVIANIANTRQIEYELTGRIFKMANPHSNKIGFVKNSSFSLDPQAPAFTSYAGLTQRLQTIYGSVVPVDLSAGAIAGEISVLIIANPRSLSAIEKFRIDQYILRGGNIVLAVSGVNVNLSGQRGGGVIPVAPDMLNFFKQYGVAIGAEMLFDSKQQVAFKQFQPQAMQVTSKPYPVWVYTKDDSINQDNIISKGQEILFMPWGTTLKPDTTMLKNKKGKETAKVEILASTGITAFTKAQVFSIDPNTLAQMAQVGAKQNSGKFNLALHVKGKFNSYFKANKLPEGAPKKFLKKSSRAAQIVAISSPYALADFPKQYIQYLDRELGIILQLNQEFIISAIDVFNGFESLSEARKSQAPPAEPKTLESWERKMYTSISFFLPLIIIFVLGYLSYLKRRQLSRRTYGDIA